MPYVTSWERKVKEERNIEIAKKMKEKGEPIEKIAEYTGLSQKEIKKLAAQK